MPVGIPVRRLAKHCDPFRGEPWGMRVTKQHVSIALKDRRFVRRPGSIDHAARIAFFVQNVACDPIEVDVGCPILGFHMQWMVQDGNHRLAAAIYAGRTHILASVGGQMDYARRLFGVNCCEL